MNDSKRVAYNTIVQVVARIITTGLSLVAIGYMLRYLGVIGNGQFTTIFAYLAILSVFVDLGLFLLQVREIAKKPDSASKISGNVLGLKFVLALVVFGLGYFIATQIYDNPAVVTGILIGSISQAAMSLAQVPVSIFQARLEMQKVSIINVISRAIYLGLILLGINYDVGLLGLVVATALSNLIMWGMSWVWVHQVASLRPRWDFKYWLELMKEALPLGAAIVFATIYFKVDALMLEAMQGDFAVGIYGAPYKIIEVMLSIATIFMTSVFPILTEALAKNKERAQRIFEKSYSFMHMLAWPLVLGVMIVGTPLMLLVAGSDFVLSGAVLKVLMFAVGLSFIGGTFNYSLIAAGYQKKLFWPYFAATIFNIVANWFVIPVYSYMGAAYTTVATELLVVIIMFVMMRKTINFKIVFKVPIKVMLSAGVMLAVLWYVGLPGLVWNLILGIAVYVGMIFVTKAVDKQTIRDLIKPA